MCLVTILTCYVIAVSLGHVIPWLPMISDCAVYPPESYLFRLGIISSGILVFLNSLMFYFFVNSNAMSRNKKLDNISLGISALASLGLAIVGAVNEDENGTVHGASAVVFFFGENIYMWACTYRLHKDYGTDKSISKKSITQKLTMSLSATIILVIFTYMSQHWGKYELQIAIAEWTGTLLIMLFNLSFCYEFGHEEYVATLLIQPQTSASDSCSSEETPGCEDNSELQSLCSDNVAA